MPIVDSNYEESKDAKKTSKTSQDTESADNNITETRSVEAGSDTGATAESKRASAKDWSRSRKARQEGEVDARPTRQPRVHKQQASTKAKAEIAKKEAKKVDDAGICPVCTWGGMESLPYIKGKKIRCRNCSKDVTLI